MDSLISVINKLQDVFHEVEIEDQDQINLPQIVVVGSQSSGKSSVLEAIVGEDFLPRGAGIVTRCPLILQLQYVSMDDFSVRNEKDGTMTLEKWGRFNHCENEVFTDFEAIRDEIIAQTERIAGFEKGITATPIRLKIFSDRVVNLTLVDLPGITKVPVEGQPEDIEQQIKDLIWPYIHNRNSIILAVSPANTDFANSESLKFARAVDPFGERTLAVLTKLDLMDKGTDAKNVLMGKVIPVKLGIIGCVNRSQQDINERKSIAKALVAEQKFLQKRYPSLAARHGTAFLAKKLSGILHNHISKCLPDLKRRINTLTSECEENLYKYGEDISEKKDLFIFNILHQYSIDYCSTVEGANEADPEVNDELGCGALICQTLHKDFCDSLLEFEMAKYSKKKILTYIKNVEGTCPGIFIPDKVFKNLAKKDIRSFLEPSLKCVDAVHEKLQETIDKCEFKKIKKDLIRFPNLSERINEVLEELLADRVQPTKDFVKSLIQIQLDYINTRHPEFRKEKLELDLSAGGDKNGKKSSRSQSPDHRSEDAADSEPEEDDSNLTAVDIENCNIIQHLLKTYIEIVRKTIEDMIPKSIMSFMVVFVKENLQKELVKKLYKEELFDELLDESEEISFFRQKSLAMLKALEKANGIINEVRNDQSKYCRQNDL